MKYFLQSCIVTLALLAGSSHADCVPLYSANVIEENSGRTLQVFVHARSSVAARQQLEATYGRGRVLRIYQESYC